VHCDVFIDCTWLCEEIWSEVCESADFGEKSWQGWCCSHGMMLTRYFAQLNSFHSVSIQWFRAVFCKLFAYFSELVWNRPGYWHPVWHTYQPHAILYLSLNGFLILQTVMFGFTDRSSVVIFGKIDHSPYSAEA